MPQVWGLTFGPVRRKQKIKKSQNNLKLLNEQFRENWKYVGDIVTPQENDSQHSRMKRFWTYIKHKRTDNKGIAPMRQNGLLPSEPTEQANILNKQFQSAFSE